MKWEFTSWGEWGLLGSQGPGVGPLGKNAGDLCALCSAPRVQDVPERRVPRVEAGREPAGGHQSPGLRAHDLAAWPEELHLQGPG